MDMNFPLGLCRQAIMKIDSANTDVHEMIEDTDIPQDKKEILYNISEYLCLIEASLTNLATDSDDETEFLSEELQMDIIEPFPAYEPDILDTEVETV